MTLNNWGGGGGRGGEGGNFVTQDECEDKKAIFARKRGRGNNFVPKYVIYKGSFAFKKSDVC